jgi:hypothetical protein
MDELEKLARKTIGSITSPHGYHFIEKKYIYSKNYQNNY